MFGIRLLQVLGMKKHFGGCNHFRLRRVLKRKCSVKVSSSSLQGPLDGIRVLDMTRVLAGPYCTMILGDMGADIIKVERPGYGDDTRSWGPPFVGDESCYFLCVNRNKKSITVDIKRPEGVKIIKELAKESDVLIENYIPGKMAEMGLGYEEMSAQFPHLIYCSISGYGQTGRDAERAGYDVIVSGSGGLMHITGSKDGEPAKVGVAMTDLSTGLYAIGAILASILARQKTGIGQHIDCNLLSTNVASLVNIGSNYLNTGMEAERLGTAHQSIVPYQAFKTKDGYFLICAGNNNQFGTFAKVIGHKKLRDDERYSTNELRVANRESLLNLLDDVFITKSTSEWCNKFEGSGLPYGPINNMQQTFSDSQVLHNGLIQEMIHSNGQTIRIPGPAVRYSDTKTVLPSPPPTLGQHNEEILHTILGYSHQYISQLKQQKVI